MQDYLQVFADWASYTILGLVQGSPLASSVNFFINDSIKVTLMLAVIVFLVASVRSYITPQKVKKWVEGRPEGVGNVVAALLGIPTPFCSCSAVPLFIGFVESGVPLGITFSFLIDSPLINEVAAAILFAMFGWPSIIWSSPIFFINEFRNVARKRLFFISGHISKNDSE